MTERVTFKDVKIGDVTYRVGSLSPWNGSWIAMLILTKLLPFGMDAALGASKLGAARSVDMTEAEFNGIQRHCLGVCARYEVLNGVSTATPILMSDGRFAFPELNSDLVTIIALTTHALVFNLAPFFQGDTLKSLKASFQDLLPFNVSK